MPSLLILKFLTVELDLRDIRSWKIKSSRMIAPRNVRSWPKSFLKLKLSWKSLKSQAFATTVAPVQLSSLVWNPWFSPSVALNSWYYLQHVECWLDFILKTGHWIPTAFNLQLLKIFKHIQSIWIIDMNSPYILEKAGKVTNVLYLGKD